MKDFDLSSFLKTDWKAPPKKKPIEDLRDFSIIAITT